MCTEAEGTQRCRKSQSDVAGALPVPPSGNINKSIAVQEMLKFRENSSLCSRVEGVSCSLGSDPSQAAILSPVGDSSLLASAHVLTSEESEQAAHWKCKSSPWDGAVPAPTLPAAAGKGIALAGGNPRPSLQQEAVESQEGPEDRRWKVRSPRSANRAQLLTAA